MSDVGSEVIKKYGILNTNLDSTSKGFGIPNPGIYIIDKNLRVLSKQFEKSYAARPSAESVLVNHLDKEIKFHVHQFKTSYLTGSIAVSDTIAYPGQVLSFMVKFTLKEGFHIYGKPIRDGYIPLTITLKSNPNFSLDSLQFPDTKKITLESINETFNILPKEFTLASFLRISKKPQLGSYFLNITIKFQACNNKLCMPPEELKYQFPIIVAK